VSGHDRPDASGRGWVLTGIDRTLALWRSVNLSSASGHAPQRASLWRPDARARPITLARERVSLSDRYDRTNEFQNGTRGEHREGAQARPNAMTVSGHND
jgi:hypothetical protein